jgi:4-diphosphocytidyl-2-C-methyl-D-erythritol kinase
MTGGVDRSGFRVPGSGFEGKLRLLAPAKVNLLLKMLRRRADGYHELVSIVDLISLYDVIHIEGVSDGSVTVADSRGVLPEGQANTAYKAAMLLKERYGIESGARIFIEKHIPIGSGLGGPSTDAATVFRGLTEVWGLKLGNRELSKLGRQIGADVPLFLYGRSCIMRGIGEKISPVKLPYLWYVVIYPEVVLSTREVYGALKIVLTKGENDIKLRGNFGTIREVAAVLENDLEKVSILMCPKIQRIKKGLTEAGAIGTLMSGSGSSVFGIFEGEAQAKEACLSVGGMGSVFVVHSLQGG